MNGKVIEIRNSWGMPVHVEHRKAEPIAGKELRRLLLWTALMGAVGGSLLTLAAVFVVQECL